MRVRREIAPTDQPMGTRLAGKGKIRAFDWKSSPLAFDPAPLVQTLVITAEVLMNIAGI